MEQNCPYCKTVNAICFWGPRREATWKRPVLLVLTLATASGCGFLAWYSHASGNAVAFTLLVSAIAGFALLSTVVAVHGCAACVARLLGEA
jgi:hypothetical protein